MLRRATLDNGLKVLVQEEHTAPLASVWCWYKVGSKDERPGLTGVSHWVEHMNFKGTTNIPRDQVKGIIEQFGGSWNGYTWIDQTTYLETATRDALDRMLFIESERMASCLYHPDDCESERTVIISELQGGENSRTSCSIRSDGHRFRRIPTGTRPLAASRSGDETREICSAITAVLRAEQRDAGDCRRLDTTRLRRVEHHFGRSPGLGRRGSAPSTEQTGERADHRPEGTTRIEGRYHAPRPPTRTFPAPDP